MAVLSVPIKHVVKIPSPANVDPDWVLELSDRENPCSLGFQAGAYLDPTAHDAWTRFSVTVSDRIPYGHSIQFLPPEMPFQYALRCVLPGEELPRFGTEEVAMVTAVSWGDILWQMVRAQKVWWQSTMANVSPKLWGYEDPHPALQAWAQRPDPTRLWYVAIRRTLPDERRGIPSYYFPEAELRF
ncbi:hypothetical protein L226DRAFT_575835 [Lentinus tigrinus ALCF2SS1-7]|uniref:Uncharacterized protein n=1 Tax=Lentinus tigrinus ALCF2SS1-6 TaxID=1328759 RepID=A0A5C2RUG5_9APHY|nr:hypothetical protein L227DRAFT_604163 [Lentinus tigrinus ALCF2SS1-6]RPD69215.1 hypothetical protein L226DRAFT_575835 [Lentinus tigrinus ALCF2SS1-7]